MITFEEAQRLIQENIPAPKEETQALLSALGSVTAEDLVSPIPSPLFDNSAMDGFVLRSEDTANASLDKPVLLKICGVIKAGDCAVKAIKEKEAYRIMTGALVPKGGDVVVPIEKATIQREFIFVDKPLSRGWNIRRQGEELKRGDTAVRKYSIVNPGVVGFLSSLGKTQVKVFKKPRVSIIATGTELVKPGLALPQGKIYDSNSSMVNAAVLEMGVYPILVRRLDDNPKRMKKVVGFALKESDIVILMGGVSVGDYDFVKSLLAEAGVNTIFWKVSQKPGKPMYFGKKDQTLVFGLPGNPASVFTCFYEYVYPTIRRFMGYPYPYLDVRHLPLREEVKSDPDKTLFLKANVRFGDGQRPEVVPLRHQASHMISSLCQANAILVVPRSEKPIGKGELALVHSLPNFAELVS